MSNQPDNVFAGTQVVALVEVRGTNNSLVHPRGAVGVVTRTPASDARNVSGPSSVAGYCAGWTSTVSGARKIRAMQITSGTRRHTRGLCAGCVGYSSFNGKLDTCITIRIALQRGERHPHGWPI